MAAAAETRRNPPAFLQQHDLFLDLAEQPVFIEAYLEALRTLHGPGGAARVAGMG